MTYGIKAGKGFTLIEMLVTLLIVSVGMLAIGAFYTASLRSESTSIQRLAAAHLAEQILEDWQKGNNLPTPDCAVGGIASGALILGATTFSCVPTNGETVPFNILLTESDAKAPIPSDHLLHSGASATPEMGSMLQDRANAGSAHVKIRKVRVFWTTFGVGKEVFLTHITKR